MEQNAKWTKCFLKIKFTLLNLFKYFGRLGSQCGGRGTPRWQQPPQHTSNTEVKIFAGDLNVLADLCKRSIKSHISFPRRSKLQLPAIRCIMSYCADRQRLPGCRTGWSCWSWRHRSRAGRNDGGWAAGPTGGAACWQKSQTGREAVNLLPLQIFTRL